METKRLGNLGELKALAKFAEYSIPVYIPYGDTERIDLIADFNGKLNKIQVKSTDKSANGVFEFCLRTTTKNTQISQSKYYTSDQVDYFVFYTKENDEVYIVSYEDCATTSVKLRLVPPANGQKTGIKMAADYTLDKFLSKPN